MNQVESIGVGLKAMRKTGIYKTVSHVPSGFINLLWAFGARFCKPHIVVGFWFAFVGFFNLYVQTTSETASGVDAISNSVLLVPFLVFSYGLIVLASRNNAITTLGTLYMMYYAWGIIEGTFIRSIFPPTGTLAATHIIAAAMGVLGLVSTLRLNSKLEKQIIELRSAHELKVIRSSNGNQRDNSKQSA